MLEQFQTQMQVPPQQDSSEDQQVTGSVSLQWNLSGELINQGESVSYGLPDWQLSYQFRRELSSAKSEIVQEDCADVW